MQIQNQIMGDEIKVGKIKIKSSLGNSQVSGNSSTISYRKPHLHPLLADFFFLSNLHPSYHTSY